MNILQSISLDFGRDTHPITVFAKQYDKESRFIRITPLNCGQAYTLESGVTARLQLTKPDGHTVINNATISGGIITAELTAQALAAAGTAVAEIGLYKGAALLSSQVFYIDVKKAAYDESAPASSDEYNALVEAFGRVDSSLDEMTDALTAAEQVLYIIKYKVKGGLRSLRLRFRLWRKPKKDCYHCCLCEKGGL